MNPKHRTEEVYVSTLESGYVGHMATATLLPEAGSVEVRGHLYLDGDDLYLLFNSDEDVHGAKPVGWDALQIEKLYGFTQSWWLGCCGTTLDLEGAGQDYKYLRLVDSHTKAWHLKVRCFEYRCSGCKAGRCTHDDADCCDRIREDGWEDGLNKQAGEMPVKQTSEEDVMSEAVYSKEVLVTELEKAKALHEEAVAAAQASAEKALDELKDKFLAGQGVEVQTEERVLISTSEVRSDDFDRVLTQLSLMAGDEVPATALTQNPLYLIEKAGKLGEAKRTVRIYAS